MKYILIYLLFTPLVLVAQRCSPTLLEDSSLANNFHQNGDRENAIKLYHSLLDSLNSNIQTPQNDFELAATYNKLGNRYQNYGDWDLSSTAYINGILALEKFTVYDSLKADLYLNLGLLYVKLGIEDKEYYLDLAEQLALSSSNFRALFVIYKVRRQLDKGIDFAKEIENKTYLTNYYYLKAFESSTKLYFDSARLVLPEISEALLQNFQYHAFVSHYFLKNNQIDSALFHIQTAENIAPLLNDDEVNTHYLDNYVAIYLYLQDYKTAYEYKYKSDSIRMHYMSTQNRDALNNLTTQRNLFENQTEIISLKATQLIHRLLLLVFLLGVLISLFFYIKMKHLNKSLTKSNEAKGKLFSIISHDLRGPLSALKFLSESPIAFSENREVFKNGLNNLLFEFENLLNWSANQLDKITVSPKNIDLAELLENCISLHSTEIKRKNIKIMFDVNADYIAFADEQMIQVCFRNLLNNAIKFSPINGLISITIFSRKQVNIEIENTIDSVEFSKGLGLGLDICKDFLKPNKGKLILSEDLNSFKVQLILPLSK